MDSDGDSVGDIQGIPTRLDYLTWLGVDAICILPFYPSPMADFGYDISDVCDVDRLCPKPDFYLWRDGKPGGGPPNKLVERVRWTCLDLGHQHGAVLLPFISWRAARPQLRNHEVRGAMLTVLAFWLDRGVDGFRVDAIHRVIKDDQYRDNPPNPDYRPTSRHMNLSSVTT